MGDTDTELGGARFGARPFATGVTARIQQALCTALPRECTAQRPAPGGGKVVYVEGHNTFNFANDIFGFNGWSCHISNLQQEYCEKDQRGKWVASASCVVKVVLRDGTSHMDVGCGVAEGMRSRHEAIKKSKKDAVTDARKRCLRVFGNGLGNCVRDKAYQAWHRARTNGAPPCGPQLAVRTRPHEVVESSAECGAASAHASASAGGGGARPLAELNGETQQQRRAAPMRTAQAARLGAMKGPQAATSQQLHNQQQQQQQRAQQQRAQQQRAQQPPPPPLPRPSGVAAAAAPAAGGAPVGSAAAADTRKRPREASAAAAAYDASAGALFGGAMSKKTAPAAAVAAASAGHDDHGGGGGSVLPSSTPQEQVGAAVASFLAAVLTEIHLCGVCSCQELLRRNGRRRRRSGGTWAAERATTARMGGSSRPMSAHPRFRRSIASAR
jgi:DNA repair and recombination protein RAD52